MVPLADLLDLLPQEYLEQLAVQLKVDAPNQVRLPGAIVFVCLLNTLANHSLVTQRLLEATFTQRTGQTTDHSSFGKRLLRIRPQYFEAIFRHLYRLLEREMTPAAAQSLRVRRVDATTVTLSSKWLSFGIRQAGGRKDGTRTYDHHHVKAVLQLSRDGLPDLLHLCKEQGEASDNRALGDPMIEHAAAGDLWVFDGGCSDRARLLALHRKKAFWLTVHATQQLRPLRLLWEAPPGEEAEEAADPVSPTEPTCRLLRVEEAVFEGAHDRQSPSRKKRWEAMPLVVLSAERYDLRTQQWKPWRLMTNLPVSTDGKHAGVYTFVEVAELYRKRWEIELFFKFLKQHLGYEHLTSRSENGIRVMIWMALITALLLIWYQRRTRLDGGWRVVKSWWAEDTRLWTTQLLASHFPAQAVPP